jgi:hypothetical protein
MSRRAAPRASSSDDGFEAIASPATHGRAWVAPAVPLELAPPGTAAIATPAITPPAKSRNRLDLTTVHPHPGD